MNKEMKTVKSGKAVRCCEYNPVRCVIDATGLFCSHGGGCSPPSYFVDRGAGLLLGNLVLTAGSFWKVTISALMVSAHLATPNRLSSQFSCWRAVRA